MPIRVVVADDHPAVLRGLVELFREDGIRVVAQCNDGEGALAALTRHTPDVLLVDLKMPRLDGIDVLRKLRKMGSAIPVVLYAGDITDAQVLEAMRLGARGVVLKSMPISLLIQCIRKVAAGGTWLEKEAVGRVMARFLESPSSSDGASTSLTPREIDITRMVAMGINNREVGARLFITEGTVKTHLHAIYEKLALKGRVQLANYAKEKGLV